MELQIGMSLGSQAESEPSQMQSGPEPLPRGDGLLGLETWNVRRVAVNTSREQVLPTASLEMPRYQPLSLDGELAEVTTGAGGSSDPISQHSHPHAPAVPFPAAGPCSCLIQLPQSPFMHPPGQLLTPALLSPSSCGVPASPSTAGKWDGRHFHSTTNKLGSPLATVKWGKKNLHSFSELSESNTF